MKKGGILMMLGAIIFLGLFFTPLWKITLYAPQYPDGLGMNIHINQLSDDEEFDIQNIDGLNHYIGMKTLPKNDEMWEFSVFPKVVIGMMVMGLIIGLLGFMGKIGPFWFLFWFVSMSVLGLLGVYDFNAWLTDYGSNLDPHASIQILTPEGELMTYKPPLFGYQKLLNFDVYSYPQVGAFLLFGGIGLSLLAWLIGRKEWKDIKT